MTTITIPRYKYLCFNSGKTVINNFERKNAIPPIVKSEAGTGGVIKQTISILNRKPVIKSEKISIAL
jgi:hypothetical protein